MPSSFNSELRAVTRLSGPVVLTQLGLMMTHVVDTLMVGHLGVTELAATALGNMWQWTFMSFGFGLVMGIDPLVSQAHGRGDGDAIALAYQRGVVLAVIISIPICIAMAFTREGLLLLGQDPTTATLAPHKRASAPDRTPMGPGPSTTMRSPGRIRTLPTTAL